MIDEKQLQEWCKLADEATPGPWYDHNPDDKLCMNAYLVSTCEIEPSIIDLPNRDVVAFTLLQAPDAVSHAAWNWDSDAAFIAAARSAVPALLDEVARLRAELDRVAPFLAVHGVTGYTMSATDATPLIQSTGRRTHATNVDDTAHDA